MYLPPLLEKSWKEIAKDVTVSLVLTEGELKAACACKLNMPCIGLGGVYNWRSARKGQELLPVLEQFRWLDRKVVICFDSDIATNAQVRVAASRLATVLAQRGAVTGWATLPAAPDGTKQGLDDLVFRSGVEALQTALSKAEVVGPGAPFHEMNTQVAIIRATGEVVELSSGNVYSAAAFSDVIYRSSTYADTTIEKEHAKVARKFTAKDWLAWPFRTEVSCLEYDPSTTAQITEAGAYNTWAVQGWACQPSKTGSLQPWTHLFEHVFNGLTPKDQQWALRWLACPLQFPGTKLATAMLVWGRQTGTGKTLIGETFASIYGRNYGTVNNLQLADKFNEWAADKQFIVGDEISLGDKRGTANSLKDMITRPTVRMNLKNRRSYVVRDCANYYFTSNHEDAIFLENNDRRIFVHHADMQPLPLKEYTAYKHWLTREGGAERLFYYFLHEVDLGDFDPQGRAPVTQAKLEMTTSGRGDTEDWAVQLATDPDSLLPPDRYPQDLWRTTDLLATYDPEHREKTKVIGLGRALAAAGVFRVAGGSNSMVIEGMRSRLWAIRNADRYRRCGPAEAHRLYTAERPSAVGASGKFDASRSRVQ